MDSMDNMDNITPKFSFHIVAGFAIAHSVPSHLLVQVLENAQNAIELIGCDIESKEFKQRVRIPARIRRKYELFCLIPVRGSYALPMTIGDPDSDLFVSEDIDKAWKTFSELLSGTGEEQADLLCHALPDSALRRRVLEYIKGMAPSAGANWSLDILGANGHILARLTEKTHNFIQSTFIPVERKEAERTITGELKSIDFTQRQLRIVYPPTQRELVCTCDDAIEDLLYENRRALIQVTGRVVLDETDQPKEIHSVSGIRDLDLSLFTINEIQAMNRILRAKTPIILEPLLNESQQLICIEHHRLNIDAFAETREGLLDELSEQIMVMWIEYALADDWLLEISAKQLKAELLASFEEISSAP